MSGAWHRREYALGDRGFFSRIRRRPAHRSPIRHLSSNVRRLRHLPRPPVLRHLFESRLYVKTDEETQDAYVERGMKPFRPSATQTLTSYYEVPPDILDDLEDLQVWAEVAVTCAKAKQSQKRSSEYRDLPEGL